MKPKLKIVQLKDELLISIRRAEINEILHEISMKENKLRKIYENSSRKLKIRIINKSNYFQQMDREKIKRAILKIVDTEIEFEDEMYIKKEENDNKNMNIQETKQTEEVEEVVEEVENKEKQEIEQSKLEEINKFRSELKELGISEITTPIIHDIKQLIENKEKNKEEEKEELPKEEIQEERVVADEQEIVQVENNEEGKEIEEEQESEEKQEDKEQEENREEQENEEKQEIKEDKEDEKDEEEQETEDNLGLHAIKNTFESSIDTSQTRFIHGNLRSGQREEFVGSIVILGDLNYGAEVVAGENIVVTGTIRGIAHAGANGNRKAIIAGHNIDCTQVRIANVVKEIKDIEGKLPYIYIENDDIMIDVAASKNGNE